MEKLFRIFLVSVVSVGVVSSIVYASSTIISVQTQSIAQGDVIANGWFQEVNDSIVSIRNTLTSNTGNVWGKNGNDIYYTGGNVGIGTNVPSDKLHIQFNSSSAGIVMTNLANSIGSRGFRVSNDNNRFNIQKTYDDGTFQANLLNILTSGFVGIGTVNPQRALDINSDSSWHSMRITRDSESHWTDFIQRPTSYGAPNVFSIYNYNRGNYYHGISISQDGNVGVGTETPSQKLEVTGNVTANDYYIATSGKWASQIGGGRSSGISIYQCPSGTAGWNPGGAWASYGCQGQISSSSTCSNIEYPSTQVRNCTYIGVLTIQ